MIRKLVFLSINETLFPQFKPYLSKPENQTIHFLMREGISAEAVAEMGGTSDYQLKEYKAKNYTQSGLAGLTGLSGLSGHSYDEAIILCRQSKNQRVNGFVDLVRFGLKQAGALYFLDISGDKRKIRKRELYRYYVLDLGLSKLLVVSKKILYYSYSYLLFLLFCTVLSVLLLPLRFLGRRRLRNKNNKAKICFAKRVHSDQSRILSIALRQLGYRVFSVNLVGHPFAYQPCDVELNLSQKNRYLRFARLMQVYFYCFLRFDLFLFQNNGESFFVSPLFQNWNIPCLFQHMELWMMRLAGKKLVFMMRDCTVRSKERIMSRGPQAFCLVCPITRESRLCGNIGYRKNNRIAERYAHRILCSTVDLAEYLPAGAQWLPNAYAVDRDFQPAYRKTWNNKDPFRIVHSSTGGINNMKGTRFLLPVMEQLKKKYSIEFIVMTQFSHEHAIKTLRRADVVLGQFLMGVYGNTEIESMIHGIPVIGYIDPRIKDLYPPGLPILSIDILDFEGSLYRHLEHVITNDGYRFQLSQKTREYAMNVHGSAEVARRLHEIIRELRN